VVNVACGLSFLDVVSGEGGGRWEVDINNVNSLAVREDDLREEPMFIASGCLDADLFSN
jgi:hypothetical protein